MNRYQIENLYKLNSLEDFRLKSIEDIKKVHGINVTEMEGYCKLDDINRNLYSKFIINFMNALGLESRNTLIPVNINYVEHTEYLSKENVEDDFCVITGAKVEAIYRDGSRKVLRTWEDKDYEDLETVKKESKKYLRFEYEHQGRNEWLHVISPNEWY